jgi:aspartate carbamoyltransferase catalytic subunit
MKAFERDDLDLLFDVAQEMERLVLERTRSDLLSDKILGLMFFQASTRTRISFESAMQRLGGGVVGFADPKMTRAGDYYAESVADTARMMANYADVLVVRHPQDGAPADAAAASSAPVINAADGYNEHPTQALLDLYTIRRERGHLDKVSVALIGDMSIRVLHSLPLGLARYQAKAYLISPADQSMPEPWLAEFDRAGLDYEELEKMDDVLPEVDVIYLVMTRSSDFHVSRADADIERPVTLPDYVIDRKKLDRARPDVILLHPLPRTDELPRDVDSHPAARYFEQAKYGVAVRMALLALILGRAG